MDHKVTKLLGGWITKLTKFFTKKEEPSEVMSENVEASESDLSTGDRRLFDVFCQFVWIQGEPLPLIFDVNSEVYTRHGINPITMKQLAAAGLITIEANGFVKKKLGKHTRLFYCGKPTKIGFPDDENNELDLGCVLLTERGKAMVNVDQIAWNQEFYDYVINRWFQQGFLLSSIQVDQMGIKKSSTK